MSDFILKIFPVEEVTVDKTELIKQALIKSKFLTGGSKDVHGETYLTAGESFCDFFEFEDAASARDNYQGEVGIKISADGYGVIMEEDAEEPTFIDRKNVVEVWNVDGNYTGWDKLTQLLEQATGDSYAGEWEIL
jgi:hypothetical protein